MEQELHRPTVARRVMSNDGEGVVLGSEPQQSGAEKRGIRQWHGLLVSLGEELLESLLGISSRRTYVDQFQRSARTRKKSLPWKPIAFGNDRCSQRFVAGDHFVERRLEGFRDENATKPEAGGNHEMWPEGGSWVQGLEQEEQMLRRGKGEFSL
jgi:hypothetical protein